MVAKLYAFRLLDSNPAESNVDGDYERIGAKPVAECLTDTMEVTKDEPPGIAGSREKFFDELVSVRSCVWRRDFELMKLLCNTEIVVVENQKI